jgi:hypothetical protein
MPILSYIIFRNNEIYRSETLATRPKDQNGYFVIFYFYYSIIHWIFTWYMYLSEIHTYITSFYNIQILRYIIDLLSHAIVVTQSYTHRVESKRFLKKQSVSKHEKKHAKRVTWQFFWQKSKSFGIKRFRLVKFSNTNARFLTFTIFWNNKRARFYAFPLFIISTLKDQKTVHSHWPKKTPKNDHRFHDTSNNAQKQSETTTKMITTNSDLCTKLHLICLSVTVRFIMVISQ